MTTPIYLDYAATTPMTDTVIKVMSAAMKDHFGNASSIHQFGRASKGLLEQARNTLAKYINAHPEEIIFTSGGTESDNTALIMGACARQEKGRHIIATQVEHEAVLKPLKRLEKAGFEVTHLPVDETGALDFETFKQALRPDTILVSIMAVNNEIGTRYPIEKIGQYLKDQDILFHTDAVQAFGPLPIDVEAMHIDLLSASSHKINGPKGIGILYKRRSLHLPSFMLGGDQETKERAGTENIPAILGFEQAVKEMEASRSSIQEKMLELRTYLLEQLDKNGVSYKINGDLGQQVPHIINLHLPGKLAEQLLIQLDLAGIAVSAGSACTAGSVEPSHVLQSMYGANDSRLSESIRISMGRLTTAAEIEQLAQTLAKIMKE